MKTSDFWRRFARKRVGKRFHTFTLYTLGLPHSTLDARHCTLYTPHFHPHTLQKTLCTPHFTLDTPHSTLLHFTPRTVHSTLHTLHFTLPLYAPRFALYTPHSTLHSLRSTLYTLHSTLYTPHFTLHTLHFPHFTLHTLHFTLHTLHFPHFTLYTLHSTLYTPFLFCHTFDSFVYHTCEHFGFVGLHLVFDMIKTYLRVRTGGLSSLMLCSTRLFDMINHAHQEHCYEHRCTQPTPWRNDANIFNAQLVTAETDAVTVYVRKAFNACWRSGLDNSRSCFSLRRNGPI